MKISSAFSILLASIAVQGADAVDYVWTDMSLFSVPSTIATGYGGCLGDRVESPQNMVRLQTCNDYPADKMTFTRDAKERLVMASSGKCMEWTGSPNPGDVSGNVYINDCNDSDHQKWYTDTEGTIKSRAAGNQCLEYYCLNVGDGNYCHVHTAACTGAANVANRGQKWKSSDPPTPQPTPFPTPAPTLAPVPAVTPVKRGGGSGDPHFTTFGGHKYDFHGGCDLVMLEIPSFVLGKPLTLQIRTRIETWWSYIEAVAIQIGDHVFEMKGGPKGEGPNYWVNGIPGNKLVVEDDDNLNAMQQELGALFAGFKIHYTHVSAAQHMFRIDLNAAGDAISMQTFKNWVSVNVKAVKHEHFEGARGLMGEYPTGAMVGRDGASMEDTDLFGKEWQVLATEPMLFHELGDVHAPTECAMPTTGKTTARRRLGQALMTEEQAALACARVDSANRDACIYDVLVTNDKETAGAY